jgi:hypothetical protein
MVNQILEGSGDASQQPHVGAQRFGLGDRAIVMVMSTFLGTPVIAVSRSTLVAISARFSLSAFSRR